MFLLRFFVSTSFRLLAISGGFGCLLQRLVQRAARTSHEVCLSSCRSDVQRNETKFSKALCSFETAQSSRAGCEGIRFHTDVL